MPRKTSGPGGGRARPGGSRTGRQRDGTGPRRPGVLRARWWQLFSFFSCLFFFSSSQELRSRRASPALPQPVLQEQLAPSTSGRHRTHPALPAPPLPPPQHLLAAIWGRFLPFRGSPAPNFTAPGVEPFLRAGNRGPGARSHAPGGGFAFLPPRFQGSEPPVGHGGGLKWLKFLPDFKFYHFEGPAWSPAPVLPHQTSPWPQIPSCSGASTRPPRGLVTLTRSVPVLPGGGFRPGSGAGAASPRSEAPPAEVIPGRAGAVLRPPPSHLRASRRPPPSPGGPGHGSHPTEPPPRDKEPTPRVTFWAEIPFLDEF